MILGHYAAAMAAKKWAPKTSLGTLFAAGVFLDLVWPVLVLTGVEVLTINPGHTPANPLVFVSYPWSHSLLMACVWGLVFGGGYFLFCEYRRGAVAVGILVVSHWILDAVVHVPDLPLTPWDGVRAGLGLWNSIPLTLAVELSALAVGLWIYLRATAAVDTIGAWGFRGLVFFILLIFAGAVFGPPPPNAATVAWSDMGQWLIVAWAAWVDRHRRVFFG